MDNKPEVVNAHARQFTSALAHLCPRYRSHFSSDFYTMQTEVIYTYARNLSSSFKNSLLKMPSNVGLQAK